MCLLTWEANAAATSAGVRGWFTGLARPPFTPNGWLGGPASSGAGWDGLLMALLMPMPGIAAWLVWRRVEVAAFRKRAALRAWGWQVLASALWPSLLFGLRSTEAGVVGAALLLVAGLTTVRRFWPLERRAALLLLPGLGWIVFSAYLSFGVWWMNRA